MKYGVLQFFSWPGRRGELQQVYDRAMERVHIMDQNDFDAVWIAEHHFSTYSVCPSINMMGTHFAAHTKNLRIGTGVSLAAFYNPIRLAEEIALLDVLSGGRVNWGAGSGFDATEFRAFGIDREQKHPRFRENVDIVLKAWQNDKLDYDGEFNQYSDLEVLPKPLQNPIPVWMAASSPDAIKWSAEKGFTIMMDPHSSIGDITAKRELYDSTLASHGHAVEGRDIPVARLLAIAPTDEQARKVAESGAQWTTGSYMKNPLAVKAGKEEIDPVQRYVDDVILWGCPERVADLLVQYEEENKLNYLLCSPLSNQSFTLFNDEVLPRLR
ncbi:MAG: LLM class flavin-dependent oxidoreductase [bacterium]|nr:LLM class flavin-dependent oxidoreductase [Gammaproteobacteria bacterium]HIL96629.1 LLM class flavin-dependent oxidoreductase [Pseudomonadales bacterium]